MHRSLLSINGKFSPFLMFSRPARGSMMKLRKSKQSILQMDERQGRLWWRGGVKGRRGGGVQSIVGPQVSLILGL